MWQCAVSRGVSAEDLLAVALRVREREAKGGRTR